MKASELKVLSIAALDRTDRPLKTAEEVDLALFAIASCGFTNTRIYIAKESFNNLCAYLRRENYKIFAEVDYEGKMCVEVEWHRD